MRGQKKRKKNTKEKTFLLYDILLEAKHSRIEL